MKKSIKFNIRNLFALLLLVFFIAGCGGGSNDDDFFDDFANDVNNVPIPPNNLPPLIAQFDSYDTDIDTILFVDELFGVLANDEYPILDTVVDFPLFTVQGGDVEGFQNGSFEYEPPAGFFGEDSFTYTIRDTATGRTSSTTVFISVQLI